jgi:putative heme-binding domain-containing protein
VLVPGFRVRELPLSLSNVNNLRYRGDGKLVALAYNGSIHVLSDEDGDDHSDREQVIASGWEELPHGVDALKAAVAADGSIYFGLGCTDFTNPYLVRDGKANYRLESERGTVLRISPDFARRDVVCTGVRFTVGLAFNRHGDLFATDQEGATWLPGGNPLDELLWIQRGRHYGFPPHHERWLPDVVDEPAVCEYGPQHQSTCGLALNEAGPRRRSFGPAEWEGDLFVAGYSRGKVYRTNFVRTSAAYVARNSLFAAVGLLAVDVAVSPGGALVLACHSGSPDWGSGPEGAGKFFRVEYVDRGAPQPLLAWAQSPIEVRVDFDRPLASLGAEGLELIARESEIICGEFVRAGDRFEVHRPGYEVVVAQEGAPRYRVRVRGARLSADARTLVLDTDAHPFDFAYALRLPLAAFGTPEAGGDPGSIDLDYTLAGVEARWEPAEGTAGEAWSAWLPHFDLAVCEALLGPHGRLAELRTLARKPGRLVLRAFVDIAPRPPAERGSLLVRSPALVAMRCDAEPAVEPGALRGERQARVEVPRGAPRRLLEVTLATGLEGPDALRLDLTWRTDRDPTERALALEALRSPWTPAALPPPPSARAPQALPSELAGGNWARGERLFFDEGKCGLCRRVHGRGTDFGPDLSDLPTRDAASVLRDIAQPSAAIHPDHVGYTVVRSDGSALTGLVRSNGVDSIRLIDSAATETVVERRRIAAFLIGTAALPTVAEAAGAPSLRVVLVAGDKDHGPGEHDYPAWQRVWKRLLAMADGVEVSTAWDWPAAADLERADVLVFYFWNHGWSQARAAELDAYVERGGGAVFLHSAVIADRDPESLAASLGLAWRHGATKFRHGALDVSFVQRHPLTRGLDALAHLHLEDESYWPLAGDGSTVEVIATGVEEGEPRPLVWTRTRGKGRVVATVLGHYAWTFDDPLFRALVLRGIAWAAGEPTDRLVSLSTVGVELAEGKEGE